MNLVHNFCRDQFIQERKKVTHYRNIKQTNGEAKAAVNSTPSIAKTREPVKRNRNTLPIIT